LLVVDASALTGARALTFDGSAEGNGRFQILGGEGDDSVIGGQEDDRIDGASGSDDLDGGGGNDKIDGGLGDDALLGGGGNDELAGRDGKDALDGGAGADEFDYDAAAESTGTGHDTITGFDASADRIDVTIAVAGVDAAITQGRLRDGKFNGDMQDLVGAGELAADHAVLVTADDGNLAGVTFLIVDLNGEAGYQANADLVIRLDSASNLGNLDVSDFV
jgi:Ca2+-binding RTX toxin-like protein